MKHEIKKIEKSALEITMSWTKEEFMPVEKEVLAEIQKTVEIPGFRKGHAPLAQIEAKYSKEIKEEITDKLLKESFTKLVEEENLKPISPLYNVKSEEKDGGYEIITSVDVYPEFELGTYKGLEVEEVKFEMTDDKLEAAIKEFLDNHAKLEECAEDHKAELGNTIDLAFEGFVDGVAFEGGKADSHQLELGSHSFIDTFEDQLVGYVKGQEGEVNVTFPTEYHSAELAGKPALFKVKVNSIKAKTAPELTEEFVKSVNFEGVEDFRTKLREETERKGTENAKVEFRGNLLRTVVEGTTVDVPNYLILKETEARLMEFEQQLKMQGMGIEQYLKMTGATIDGIYEQLAPMSESKVKMDLILNKIAEVENLTVAEEELNAKAEEFAASYGMKLADLTEELTKNGNLNNFRSSIKADMLINKSIDFIAENIKR